ncbi:MAG TPA: DUF2325 domain-containing protein [Nitrosomonas sp.]|mgnify:CR=1 FL=1|nr:DUF2325 domain-containing protein [Nitrosomonas sp.]HRB33424.1 DUF2325 domain-containing protein [Nitrosomonas sp.]HRB78383.1 DUF2325 domain-containing protein [Nitrosomonas sp.]
MTVLIVGGDYVTSFKYFIATQHDARIEHWSGRTKGHNKRQLPHETKLVIVIFDFINHNLANSIKAKANRNGIPLLYCHRSINELKRKLTDVYPVDQKSCCEKYCSDKNQSRKLH